MKTIILGVGNKILGDDGVGVQVANILKKRISSSDVVIDEAATGGLNLLDMILGYDKAILIDAVKTENGQNGEVRRIPFSDFATMHSTNPHDMSLVEAVNLAKRLGVPNIPSEIVVIGILMNQNSYDFSEGLSAPIADAVPKAVELTLNEIGG